MNIHIFDTQSTVVQLFHLFRRLYISDNIYMMHTNTYKRTIEYLEQIEEQKALTYENPEDYKDIMSTGNKFDRALIEISVKCLLRTVFYNIRAYTVNNFIKLLDEDISIANLCYLENSDIDTLFDDFTNLTEEQKNYLRYNVSYIARAYIEHAYNLARQEFVTLLMTLFSEIANQANNPDSRVGRIELYGKLLHPLLIESSV